MDFISNNLSIILAFVSLVLLVIVFSQIISKNELIDHTNAKLEVLRGRVESLKMEAKASGERELKINKELSDAYARLEKHRLEAQKLQGVPEPKGYTSAELREKLRFLLPDNEVAKNVKVKLVGHKLTATVRKKVGSKFTDVAVVPVIQD